MQIAQAEAIGPTVVQGLKAPFPWFGGKSRVAHLVWERFGAVRNYVEPFAGSLAVLLGRPTAPGVETVNDLDCYLANFWRALAADPEAVARYADWPVNEADLHARHTWLRNQEEFRERMKTDPEYFDAKVAGWWVWGLSAWIGGEWCKVGHRRLPHLFRGKGVNRKIPNLGDFGKGIHRSTEKNLLAYMNRLSDRLRRVRVACGDWSRVLGDSVTWKQGLTGVFLDPPYSSERATLYAEESFDVAHDVREWAIANGGNPLLRIALCGYEGEHAMPDGWAEVEWKTQGGMANTGNGRGRENAAKERIWFSQHCLESGVQDDLF